MTASVERSATTPWPGLLEKLMAVVRAEFRVDLHVPDPDHPVLGRGTCPVTGCDRSPTGNGLCSSHQKRWVDRGRPELAAFLTDPGPPVNGRRDLTACTVPGCRYGSSGLGLCMRHRSAWTTSGHPDPAVWAIAALAADPVDRMICRLPFCSLWIEGERNLFCKAHETRWRMQGRPEVEEFIARCLLAGRDRIDFSGLAPQLKLELQYAVQCRADQATITLPPPVVAWTIRKAREAGVMSLLDHTAQWWADAAGPKTSSYPAFLAFARDAVETLHEGTGWQVEYPRDVWRLERLPGLTGNAGKTHARHRLRFDRIAQPWIRVPVKRWSRLRLSSGTAVGTVVSDVKALRRFSEFLAAAAPEVEALAGVDRALLERYLAWLATAGLGHGAREDAVTCPGMFFQALRQHDWDPSLPTTAVFFAGDLPPRPSRLTRHLAEHVMAQVEAPANLDRWPNPEGRLVTLILIQCGLRATDACTLSFDCLLHDGQGAPYLRYFNNKMRREAAVPIDADLEAEIRAQQQRVAARWPQQHPHLFPQLKGNVGGRRPLSYYSYRGMLNSWLALCEVHDEHGQPVHLTPHQWRHTFACRLINRDVPQEVIRVLLDHQSTQMTAHYARITDQTVRRHWEQATKVNIQGERIDLDPDGPLAQAQWAKTRYGMATQTLPHGYCGLPVQKSCPHANACLTCPVFLTGPEFLPELREHRGRTLTLIDSAHANGHTRVAQMNTEVLTNLDRMISQIDEQPPGAADAG
ncbi:MAG: tyrosine-type recombinase/integrase [Pseudonocardiales bacterium]